MGAGNKALMVWTSKDGASSWESNSTGLPSYANSWGELDVADIDGDGDLDLAAPSEGTWGGD